MSRLLSLFSGRPVISDGAWGTEFQKRGLAVGEAADFWNLERPEDVEAVARSYVEAGSQVILTNTFRANAVALRGRAGADVVEQINRRGVEISRKAAGASVRVVASMGPTGKLWRPARSKRGRSFGRFAFRPRHWSP
ncbi:MAG: homocysteine S-methyltransferase family protein, partial [Planctomycetaceae bacterium]|nr:homocysteine S-methyltransferase family protein [Planctomycetaceae bacterium]